MHISIIGCMSGIAGSYWVDFLPAEVRLLAGRFRTRALLMGDGPPLVLIHGTGGHLENFARNVRVYAERYRVIAIDLLWHGRSQVDAFDADLFPAFIAQIADVLDVLGIERAHIEGQSLGGWIAALFAARHAERVGKLVLTTPMGYIPEGASTIDYGTVGRDPLREAMLAVLREPTYENVRLRMERIVADPATLTAESIAVRHALYNDAGLNAVQRRVTETYFSDAVRPSALTGALLATIAAPTLVYWGERNFTSPAVGLEMSRKLANGRFHSAAGTGHWAQFENAEEHNRVVLEFLDARRASPDRAVTD